MFNRFSRRKFVKATSGFAAGVAAVGSVPLINLLRANAQNSTSSWMEKLPDNIKISKLTIPGTHETCALYGDFIFTSAICQNKTLKDQLSDGIRFIDIRCRHIDDTFAIHHGSVYQKQKFGTDVRDVCIAFLKANPSEFIIMSVKPEYKDEKNTRSFEDTFDWYIQGTEGFWYLGESIPTLKDVRGKIVLLRRFSAKRLPKGINASPWKDDATFEINNQATLKIQDKYSVSSSDIERKWEDIKSLLDIAKSDTSDSWYINFSSGTSLFTSPKTVADRINPKLFDYLGSEKFSNRLGTFAMDFPNDNLIRRIISLNE